MRRGAAPTDYPPDLLRRTILALATPRGPAKTICPSEAARALAGPDEKVWRLLMKPIRAEAVRMADEGLIEIRRRGRPIDPHDFRGIYRIAIAGGAAETKGPAD